jgi:sigma-B regulation protein RsbU (phosphoserine phosphatase)
MAAPEQLAEHRFPAYSKQLRNVRQLVRDVLQKQGCSQDFVDSTVLAVDEATCNVMRHAYRGDETGDIIIQIRRDGPTLIFRLIDFAPPVEIRKVKSRNLDEVRPGGLGVYLIKQIMDTMQFESPPEGAGNMLVMTRKLESE